MNDDLPDDGRPRLPSELDFPVFLMNFPFTVDNRDPNNTLMKDSDPPYNMDEAFRQFMGLYKAISAQSLVYILPSGGDYQDLPFVANLGIIFPTLPGTAVLSNFTSPPRMGEEDVGAAFFRQMGYEIAMCPSKWEGEADLKYIRDNVYVGGYGQRSERESYRWMMREFDLDITEIELPDDKLYHLDCSFFPLDGERALVATSVLDPRDVASIEKLVDIIQIPPNKVYEGWTNAVRIGDTIYHAPHDGADPKVYERFIAKNTGLAFEPIDLTEFDKSGADLSCLIMHLNRQNIPEAEEPKMAMEGPARHGMMRPMVAGGMMGMMPAGAGRRSVAEEA